MCQFFGSKLCHTTAFHPAANGLNERFNRSLKVALKCQSSPDLWYRNLSLVILRLRSAIKEDMGCAAVEMALGTSIRFPGEYFENSTPVELSEENTVQPTSQYAKTLCSFMSSLRYTVPRHPKKQQTYVDPLLFRCSQAVFFLRRFEEPKRSLKIVQRSLKICYYHSRTCRGCRGGNCPPKFRRFGQN